MGQRVLTQDRVLVRVGQELADGLVRVVHELRDVLYSQTETLQGNATSECKSARSGACSYFFHRSVI